METVTMHLSLTRQAADLLETYCTKRTRGTFISQLVLDHDRMKNGAEGMIEQLRKQTLLAEAEANRLRNLYKKTLEAHQPSQPQNNGNSKGKHR